ncbi:uncharacterized protein J3R85_009178 [Psidium guajava]|nr:uncharacterized protein J3R85_009178 [Psidium guajava]
MAYAISFFSDFGHFWTGFEVKKRSVKAHNPFGQR